MTAAHPAYMELIDLIAAGATPERLIAFRPSAATQERLEYLLSQERDGVASTDEQSELDYLTQLEHILRLAKARAEQLITIAP